MPDLRRSSCLLAGALALACGAGTALLVSAPSAAAAAPRAQAVGRFLDGQLGPQSLEDVVDVQDARASNPGTVSDRNPLDVTLGRQATIPLSGKLQQPGSGNAIHTGAVNQVATARSTGYSYGAAGAVANSGGASIGANNAAYPANATITLSPDALPSAGTIPLPGAGSLPALGSVRISTGAVSALASTPAGFRKPATTRYAVGGLRLIVGSPALAGVLGQLGDTLVAPSLPSVPGLPAGCSFKTQVLSPISLDGGAVTITPSRGALTVDLAALLRRLGLDLNGLPANTDLLDYLLHYLAGPAGLAHGLQAALHGVLDPMQKNFTACLHEFSAAFPKPFDAVVQQAFDQLTGGQAQLEAALNGAVAQLAAAAGSNPLAPLADGLRQLVDIGVNVQPHGRRGSFTSALRATPDQATPVIAGQTLVRALEIQLAPAAGATPAATIALANAAAGPSTPVAVEATKTTSPHAPAGAPNTRLPTAVPAGLGSRPGPPTTPLVLLSLALALAGAGALAHRARRGRHG